MDDRFLEPREVERLAQAIEPRYRTFVLVGAYAGLRHGELAALRAGRVDTTASTIDVVETRTMGQDGTPTFGPPKSRAGRRTVPSLASSWRSSPPTSTETGSLPVNWCGPPWTAHR